MLPEIGSQYGVAAYILRSFVQGGVKTNFKSNIHGVYFSLYVYSKTWKVLLIILLWKEFCNTAIMKVETLGTSRSSHEI